MKSDALELPPRTKRAENKKLRKGLRCFERILVVTDLTDGSIRAITVARSLAQRFCGRLTVLYTHEIPRSLEFMRGAHCMEAIERDAKRAYDRFAQLCRCVRAQGGEIETQFRLGNPGDETLWVAKALDADLLILPAEEDAKVDRPEERLDTKGILRDSPCPVLLVHRESAG